MGTFYVCGKLSKRGTTCMGTHRKGEPCSHGNFEMTSPGRRAVKAALAKRKQAAASPAVSSSSDDDDAPIGEVGSPRLAAKRKKAKKEAKKAAKAAQEKERARLEAENAELRRAARVAKRAMGSA